MHRNYLNHLNFEQMCDHIIMYYMLLLQQQNYNQHYLYCYTIIKELLNIVNYLLYYLCFINR